MNGFEMHRSWAPFHPLPTRRLLEALSIALDAHLRWWREIWKSRHARGEVFCTVTPEFGPDGYLHTLPFTDQPVADLWSLNTWIADRLRQEFAIFTAENEASNLGET